MTIKEYIGKNSKIEYDEHGSGYFFIKNKQGDTRVFADMEIRGWGEIQYKFKTEEEARDFQDELGHFVAEAINEKLEKLK